MRRPKISILYVVIVGGALVALIVAGRYSGRSLGGDMLVRGVARPAAYLFDHLLFVRNWSWQVANFRNLESENARLKEENIGLTSKVGKEEALMEENGFLRKALQLPLKNTTAPQIGNIFSISQSPYGYIVLLNIGYADGVETQRTVLTSDGVLVGSVREVYERTSSILPVNDPEFSVTARVLGGDTVGIARGAGIDGMLLDLIVHGDVVEKDNVIVTSGDDLFPPGLVIGKVVSVQESNSTVFKKVVIAPYSLGLRQGRVLVTTK